MKKVLLEYEGTVESGVMGIIYITFPNLMFEIMFKQGAYDFRTTQLPIVL